VVSVVGAKDALRSPEGQGSGANSGDRRVVCQGHVDTREGVVRIYSEQLGRVKKVLVADNDDVKEGAPLFEVDSQGSEDLLAEAKAALKEAEAGVLEAEVAVKAARQKEKQYEENKTAQSKAVEARERELNAAKEQLDLIRKQAKNGLVKPEDLKRAEETVKGLEAGWEAEKAKLRALEALDPKLGTQLAEARKKQTEATKERAEIAVRKAELGVQKCTVRAPAKGKVLRVLTKVGEVLSSSPQYPALEFIADGPRIVRAEIEQEWANRLRPGMKARIRDETRAGEEWEGNLIRVSDWYTHRRSQLFEPLQVNDVRTVECLIEFTEPNPPVRIGQRVRVTLE
jgi:multidrug resistance efflux pump